MNMKVLILSSSLLFLVACEKLGPIPPKESFNSDHPIVHTKQNSTIFPGLPVQFYTQEDINASPKSRPLSPPKCMPLYFNPKDVITKQDASGEYHYIKKNNKSYNLFILENDASTPEYTFKEHILSSGDCKSKSLLILKDGKQYAWYSHIVYGGDQYGMGWTFYAQGKKLLIHNIVLENGQWMEKTRIIDLATKKVTELPLDPCLTYGEWNAEGFIVSNYREPKDGAPTVYCLLKGDGTLIYKEHPLNVLGTSLPMFFIPQRYDIGFMLDMNSQVLVDNKVFAKENPERHRLIVLDFIKKDQWATFLFPRDSQPNVFLLDMGNYNPEYDLSSFTWTHPKIRFRTKRYDSGQCCTGSWKWGEWQDLVLEKIFN
jgi:hypothetical protein